MSATLLGAVFYLDLPHSEKMMLLAMADHADDDGQHIFPGMGRLSAKVSLKERHARNQLAALEKRGYIARVAYPQGGRGHAVEWAIDAVRVYREARTLGWTHKTRHHSAAFDDLDPALDDLNPAPQCRKPGTTVP